MFNSTSPKLYTQFAVHPWSYVHSLQPRYQSSWGQHGVHLGPVGPGWAPYWPHEPCYQGIHLKTCVHGLCFVGFQCSLATVNFAHIFEDYFTGMMTRLLQFLWSNTRLINHMNPQNKVKHYRNQSRGCLMGGGPMTSIANALELCLSCTNPLIRYFLNKFSENALLKTSSICISTIFVIIYSICISTIEFTKVA